MSVLMYLPHEDRLATIQDAAMLEALVLELEAADGLLACAVEAEGGAGSTLLNFALPDFTVEEERALVYILMTASERTVREYEDSRRVCDRRIAELQGFRVLEGGPAHG